MSLDITGGVDVSVILSNRERVKMKGENAYSFEEEKVISSRKTDIRLRLLTELNMRMFSIFASYARWVTNYYPLYVGGQPEAYSHFIQAGIGYRLK